VFPLIPGNKTPATKHGKDDATTDLRVIRSWWRRNPNYNIGLVCGVIFDVLDIDIKDGRPQEDAIHCLHAGQSPPSSSTTISNPTDQMASTTPIRANPPNTKTNASVTSSLVMRAS
jgi:hypothetical protein